MAPKVSPRAYERIVFVALGLLVLIIITGGAVRVTGSGLGCSDWPNCHAGKFTPEVRAHDLIEFGNRMLTGIVAAGVAAGVLGSLFRSPRRRDLTVWSIWLVVGVVAQAVLGGVSVLVELDPPFIAAHFLLSLVLVWAGLVLYRRARQPEGRPHPVMTRDFVILSRVVVALTIVVLVLGTFVTGSGPHGGSEDVTRLAFEPKDITRIHSSFVWLLLLVTVLLVWRLHVAQVDPSLRRKGEIAIAAMMVQGAIGYLQYALGVPSGLVLLHIAGAVAVWISVVWFALSFHERWESSGLTSYDGPPGADDSSVPTFDI